MPKRPSPILEQPTPLSSWDIYRAAAKARWIGTVEAADEGDAIKRGADQFKAPA
jgi:hypothetical protein